jgi:hypothetical protein
MKLKAASINTYCIYNLNNWSNFVCIRVIPEQTITSFNPMTETSLSLRALSLPKACEAIFMVILYPVVVAIIVVIAAARAVDAITDIILLI